MYMYVYRYVCIIFMQAFICACSLCTCCVCMHTCVYFVFIVVDSRLLNYVQTVGSKRPAAPEVVTIRGSVSVAMTTSVCLESLEQSPIMLIRCEERERDRDREGGRDKDIGERRENEGYQDTGNPPPTIGYWETQLLN